MWVSSGTTSLDGGTTSHPPGSTSSRLTIQRRKRLSLLQALPLPGAGIRKSHPPGKNLHKGRKGRDDGIVITAKPGHKALLKRTMLLNDRLHAPEQAGKVLPGREPVFEVRKASSRLSTAS